MKRKKIQFSKRVEYPEVYLGYQENGNCSYNDIIEVVFQTVNEYLTVKAHLNYKSILMRWYMM